jgi:putative hydrolase of the HAD superfamily
VSPLRAVLLDAGGTLFTERTSRAAIYAATARRHGVAVEEAAAARALKLVHARLPQRLPQRSNGRGDAFRYSRPWFEHFIAAVFAEVGVCELPAGVAPDLFATFADPATFRLFDEVVPTLARLRERGLKLAVVSNWSPALPELLAGLGIAGRFDVVVSSGREGVEKPDPAIFARALDRLGVAPAEALHVGDHPVNDVAGAQAAGIAARLIDRTGGDRTGSGAAAWRSLEPLVRLADDAPAPRFS